MVRKSKLIGQTINNFYVLDSFHIKNDTRLQVRCENCKTIQEKNRRSILNSKCECDNCGNGRKRRNANGYYGTPIYTRYMEILSRLKHNAHYKEVKMCDEWLNDFMKFYEWSMENGYRENLTIDRIDNTKGYSPDNCRWATLKEQANNRTNNFIIEYNGEIHTVHEWAIITGISSENIRNRIKNFGWTTEKALNTLVKHKEVKHETNQI